MKKIITCFVLVAFATTSFCQQTVQKQTLTQKDYLEKSKKQKKIAWILFGGGVALIATGALIPEGELTGDINWIAWSAEHKNDGIKGAFILAGGLSMLGSIPFFIASGKNKRRANQGSVFINIERTPVLQGMVFSNQSFPVLGVKINL